jgi:hypothetical protein
MKQPCYEQGLKECICGTRNSWETWKWCDLQRLIWRKLPSPTKTEEGLADYKSRMRNIIRDYPMELISLFEKVMSQAS